MLELESGRGGDTAELSRELHQLRVRADKLEADGKRKDEENRKLSAAQTDPAAVKAQEESFKVGAPPWTDDDGLMISDVRVFSWRLSFVTI